MLLRSLELSVEISDMVSLLPSLHCGSVSPRMNTGVHLNTSVVFAGIVRVALARRCWLTAPLLLVVLIVDDDDGVDVVIDAIVVMTIFASENFRASESMFFLKLSLRPGLKPNRPALDGDFVLE